MKIFPISEVWSQVELSLAWPLAVTGADRGEAASVEAAAGGAACAVSSRALRSTSFS
jgi:hypothetical protein